MDDVLLLGALGLMAVLMFRGKDGAGFGLPSVGLPSGSASPTTDGPAQGDAGVAFNINDLDTKASYSEDSGQLTAHLGFGHVGPGGVYTVRVDVRSTGFLGAGVQPWMAGAAQQVQIATDADWTGYGFDFQFHLDRSLFNGIDARFGIYTPGGVLVQERIVGVSFGF